MGKAPIVKTAKSTGSRAKAHKKQSLDSPLPGGISSDDVVVDASGNLLDEQQCGISSDDVVVDASGNLLDEQQCGLEERTTPGDIAVDAFRCMPFDALGRLAVDDSKSMDAVEDGSSDDSTACASMKSLWTTFVSGEGGSRSSRAKHCTLDVCIDDGDESATLNIGGKLMELENHSFLWMFTAYTCDCCGVRERELLCDPDDTDNAKDDFYNKYPRLKAVEAGSDARQIGRIELMFKNGGTLSVGLEVGTPEVKKFSKMCSALVTLGRLEKCGSNGCKTVRRVPLKDQNPVTDDAAANCEADRHMTELLAELESQGTAKERTSDRKRQKKKKASVIMPEEKAESDTPEASGLHEVRESDLVIAEDVRKIGDIAVDAFRCMPCNDSPVDDSNLIDAVEDGSCEGSAPATSAPATLVDPESEPDDSNIAGPLKSLWTTLVSGESRSGRAKPCIMDVCIDEGNESATLDLGGNSREVAKHSILWMFTASTCECCGVRERELLCGPDDTDKAKEDFYTKYPRLKSVEAGSDPRRIGRIELMFKNGCILSVGIEVAPCDVKKFTKMCAALVTLGELVKCSSNACGTRRRTPEKDTSLEPLTDNPEAKDEADRHMTELLAELDSQRMAKEKASERKRQRKKKTCMVREEEEEEEEEEEHVCLHVEEEEEYVDSGTACMCMPTEASGSHESQEEVVVRENDLVCTDKACIAAPEAEAPPPVALVPLPPVTPAPPPSAAAAFPPPVVHAPLPPVVHTPSPAAARIMRLRPKLHAPPPPVVQATIQAASSAVGWSTVSKAKTPAQRADVCADSATLASNITVSKAKTAGHKADVRTDSATLASNITDVMGGVWPHLSEVTPKLMQPPGITCPWSCCPKGNTYPKGYTCEKATPSGSEEEEVTPKVTPKVMLPKRTMATPAAPRLGQPPGLDSKLLDQISESSGPQPSPCLKEPMPQFMLADDEVDSSTSTKALEDSLSSMGEFYGACSENTDAPIYPPGMGFDSMGVQTDAPCFDVEAAEQHPTIAASPHIGDYMIDEPTSPLMPMIIVSVVPRARYSFSLNTPARVEIASKNFGKLRIPSGNALKAACRTNFDQRSSASESSDDFSEPSTVACMASCCN